MSPSPNTEEPYVEEWSDGLTWIADPEEPIQRASHALPGEDGLWLVDPVTADGIHDTIEALGPVTGVTVLLDRHKRDTAAFARHYDVPVHAPAVLADRLDGLGVPVESFNGALPRSAFRARPVVSNRLWREAALVSADGATAVVPEALGTVPFFRAPGERLGVHPGLRLWPPRHQLEDLDPDRLLVGHGAPVTDDAGAAVQDALAGARRRAPRAYWRMLRSLIGG